VTTNARGPVPMHIASASGSGSRKQSAVVEGDGLLVWSAGTPVVNSGVAWEDPDDHPWLSVATLVAVAVSSPFNWRRRRRHLRCLRPLLPRVATLGLAAVAPGTTPVVADVPPWACGRLLEIGSRTGRHSRPFGAPIVLELEEGTFRHCL
jgi:hypothetical protein